MLLAQPSDILSDLGFDSMPDILSAATMALDAAEQQLAAALNTDFAQGAFTEMFYIREGHCRSSTEFRLSQGFVSSLTSVKACYDLASLTGQPTVIGDFGQLCDLSPGSTPVEVTSMVTLDSDRGVIKDIQNRYRHLYVQIVYQAGFAVDPDNSASYLLTSVPDWLQQAAKLAATLGLADSGPIVEAGLKIDKQLVGQRYTSLISRKMRYAPLAFLPL
jgi:hypothetical protein